MVVLILNQKRNILITINKQLAIEGTFLTPKRAQASKRMLRNCELKRIKQNELETNEKGRISGL